MTANRSCCENDTDTAGADAVVKNIAELNVSHTNRVLEVQPISFRVYKMMNISIGYKRCGSKVIISKKTFHRPHVMPHIQ